MRLAKIAVAALLVVSAGACADERDPATDRPLVEVAGSYVLDGSDVEVVLPIGRFDLTITDEMDALSPAQSEDGEAHEAPDGWAFVGLGWRPAGDIGVVRQLALHGTEAEVATVSVRDGSRSHEFFEVSLRPGDAYARSAWVLVRSGLEDTAVEVTYDGVTQDVDLATKEVEPGVAAGLYDLEALPVDCPDSDQRREELSFQVECTIDSAYALPYVAEKGWAPAGSTWLVFNLTLQPSTFLWTGAGGRESVSVEKAVGQLDPGATVLLESEAGASGYFATVAVEADRAAPTDVRIGRRYLLEPVSENGSRVELEPTFDVTVEFPPSPTSND